MLRQRLKKTKGKGCIAHDVLLMTLLLWLCRQGYTCILVAKNPYDKHTVLINAIVNGMAALNTQPITQLDVINFPVEAGLVRYLFESGYQAEDILLGLSQPKCRNAIHEDRFKISVSAIAEPITCHRISAFPWPHAGSPAEDAC